MVDFDAEQDVLMADVITTFGVSVTLTRSSRGNIDWSALTQTSSTTTQNVSAVRRPTVKVSFGAGTSGRSERSEEVVYDIKVADVTGTITADANDQWLITDGAKAMEIQKVEYSVDKKNYILTARSAK